MINFVSVLFFISPLFNGVVFEFLGKNYNPERILLFLFLLPLGIKFFISKKQQRGSVLFEVIEFKHLYLILFWMCGLLVSTVLTTDPVAHFPGLLISYAPFFVFYLYLQNDNFSELLEVSILGCLWFLAIGCLLVFVAWKISSNDITEYFIDRDRVRLFALEPNILGGLIGFYWILHFPYFKKCFSHIFLYCLLVIALLLTFSKSPYFAFLVSIFVYFFLAKKIRSSHVFFLLMGMVFVGLIFLFLYDYFLNFYLDNLDRQDGVDNRLVGLEIAWNRFLENPVWGNGPLDFGLDPDLVIYMMGSELKSDAWIWQMTVAVLHDGGIVGFLAYFIFLISLSFYSVRLALRHDSIFHASYFSAFLMIFIASQTTTIHLTSAFGIAFGLMATKYLIKE